MHRRLAAIDAGSNAIRLMVGDVIATHPLPLVKKVGFYRLPLPIGQDVFRSGEIGHHYQLRLRDAFLGMAHWLRVLCPDATEGVATAAFRAASNGIQISEWLTQETGIPLRVISGMEEAQLIVSACPARASHESVLYVDVGGGSTELTAYQGDTCVLQTSIPIGALRVSVQGLADGGDLANGTELSHALSDLPPADWVVMGTGGNVSKLPSMLGLKEGMPIRPKKIAVLWQQLRQLSVEERMIRYGLKPDRAESIVPALHILNHVLATATVRHVFIPKCGLVDGLIQTMALEVLV